MLRVYAYENCDTCRKAVKWLNEHKVRFEEIQIREHPPTLAELKAMLNLYDGDLRRLFNTSGMDFRALDLKSKLPYMTETEALGLLSRNGNLVKRPFAIFPDGKKGAIGFSERQWEAFK